MSGPAPTSEPAVSDPPEAPQPKERTLAEAESEAALAKAEAKDAKAEAEEAKADLAALKAGKLVRFGVTGGIGPILQVPLHRAVVDGATLQPTTAVGTMPYALFLPEFWRTSRPEQSIFCANHWAGKDAEDAAQVAADNAAKKRADGRVRVLKAAVVAKRNSRKKDGEGGQTRSHPSLGAVKTRRQRRIHRDLYALADVLDDKIGGDGALSKELEGLLEATCEHRRAGKGAQREPCRSYVSLTPSRAGILEGLIDTSAAWDTSSHDDITAWGRARWLAHRIDRSIRRERRRDFAFARNVDAALASWQRQGHGLDEAIHASLMQGIAPSRYAELDNVTHDEWELAESVVAAEAEHEGADDDDAEVEVGDRKRSLADANEDLRLLVQSSSIGWQSGVPGKCARYKFGFYVGYPLKFDVTVPVEYEGDAPTRRDVKVTEIVSVGLGISPNAYVSILAGLSVGVTKIPPGDNDREAIFGFVFGLGGNLDLLTLLKGG